MTNSHAMDTPRACEICGTVLVLAGSDSPHAAVRARTRYRLKRLRFCSPTCQGIAQRRDPARQAKTRSGASHTAMRLCPWRPCQRCGEVRRSQVHHRDRNFMNNAPDNLERLCHWCHAKEHAPETKARAAHHWAVRRARYGPGGHR